MDLMTDAEACLELRVSRRTPVPNDCAGDLPAPKRFGNFRKLYFKRAEFEKACKKAMR